MFSSDSFTTCDKWCFDCFETRKRGIEADAIIKQLREKYTFLGLGRERIVFRLKSGNYVLKFPLGCSGERANDWEGSVITNKNKVGLRKDIVITPKTRWVNYKGFVCVIMEYVNEEIEREEYPDWSGSVDDGQVGKNRDGKIVAFDFG